MVCFFINLGLLYLFAMFLVFCIESIYNAGDPCSIPGLKRSPGGGHGNPLQYSCLKNPQPCQVSTCTRILVFGQRFQEILKQISETYFLTSCLLSDIHPYKL